MFWGELEKHWGRPVLFGPEPLSLCGCVTYGVGPGAQSGSLLHFSTWGLRPKTPHGVFTQELTIVNSSCAQYSYAAHFQHGVSHLQLAARSDTVQYSTVQYSLASPSLSPRPRFGAS